MGSNIKILKDKLHSHNKWLILFIGILIIFSIFFEPNFRPNSQFWTSKLKFSESSSFNTLFLGQNSSHLLVALTPFSFIEGTSLKPLSIPYLPPSGTLGTILGSGDLKRASNEIREYVVQSGDTLSSIAKTFGIDIDTIARANNISAKAVLNPGDKLIILPVSGLLHYVKEGDTVSSIAQTYQVNPKDIIDFNELSKDGQIFIGDLLIIPNGKLPQKIAQNSLVPLTDSFFISPLGPNYRISQGLHWYNAVDLTTGQCSSPVFAAAGGKIQKTGLDRIAGKYIRILHGSGVVTFYGHLSSILVVPGQQVSQGELIGYTGYTGYTVPQGPAGCHLHFEVRGARNPFAS